MKKITELLVGLFLLSAFSVTAYAGSLKPVEVMQTKRSQEIKHPAAVGKSYAVQNSTTEAVVCTGKCLLFDVILTSGADGAYAIVRDTATADGSGDVIFTQLEFDGTGLQAMSQGSNAFPIVTSKGITADLSSVGSNEEALIIYIDLD